MVYLNLVFWRFAQIFVFVIALDEKLMLCKGLKSLHLTKRQIYQRILIFAKNFLKKTSFTWINAFLRNKIQKSPNSKII